MADSTPKTHTISDNLNDWLGLSGDSSLTLPDSSWGTMGLSAAGLGKTWSDYFAKETSAKNSQAFQNYSNSMTDLSNAVNQDSITLNQIQYLDASAEKASQIQTQGMQALGGIQAAAAAAGVRGNSVEVSMNRAEGAAATAEFNRQREVKYALLGFDQARTNSTLATAMNKKYGTFSGGSLALSGIQSAISVGSLVGVLL